MLISVCLSIALALPSPGALGGSGPAPWAAEAGDHNEALLANITALGRPGNSIPGEVVAFGENSFLVASAGGGDGERGVIGAATFHRGRVLVFGHSSFFGGWGAGADGEAFLLNSIRWAAGKEQPRVAFLAGGHDLAARLKVHFAETGHYQRCADLPLRGSGTDVVVWVGGAPDEEQIGRLSAFVKGGGGVLLGVCPWGNQQIWDGQGRGKNIRTDLSQNQLIGEMGLVLGDATVGDAAYNLASNRALPHAGQAMDAAVAYITGSEGEQEIAPGSAASQVAGLLRALPASDDRFLPRIQSALEASSFAERVPGPGHKTRKSDVAGHLGMLLATEAWRDTPASRVPAAPGADFFPGAIPSGALRITRSLDVTPEEARQGGWISTGLYAGPGEVIRISATGGAAGWKLRIGAHKDKLWHKDSWSRWPEITLERQLVMDPGGSFEVASPFGGLIYFVPPRNAVGAAGANGASFMVAGAVEAPLFRLGDPASAKNWKQRRAAPAPWAELVCDGMILTIPSGAIRELDDPVALMEYWQRAADCYPELRGEPQPARAERMVEDIQISAGWMHSGYPVMTHGAERADHSAAVDLDTLTTAGNWGYFHEFGHNAQKREWTFSGTGEVTNNLFSLYLGEQMAGIEPWNNPWLAGQKDKPAEYFAKGSKFSDWKRSPGLALMMYATIQRDFGWEPFQTAFKAYLEAPAAESPKTDAQKQDRWMTRMSQALERDLGPYFEYWGVPITEAARGEVAHFEPWMPEEYGKP